MEIVNRQSVPLIKSLIRIKIFVFQYALNIKIMMNNSKYVFLNVQLVKNIIFIDKDVKQNVKIINIGMDIHVFANMVFKKFIIHVYLNVEIIKLEIIMAFVNV